MKTLFLIKLNILLAVFSFISLLSGNVFANKNASEKKHANSFVITSKKLAAQIDQIVESYVKLHRFSGSVLVAKDDKLVFSKGYGLANIKSKIPITTQTIFNIGSLSKQFTAAAILKLEGEGKLSVSDTIDKYLPAYPQPQGKQITIHHLLTHTSGIPSLWRRDGLPDIEGDENPISTERLLSIFQDKELQFAPGTKFRYSNSAYSVLGAIVESVSGMSFSDYLRQNLFLPAGMKDTSFVTQSNLLARTATGYEGFYPNQKKAPAPHPTWNLGGGGVFSTVEDLFKWNKALSSGKVLPSTQVEKEFKGQVKLKGEGRFYGYGWFIELFHGHPLITHNGTTDGTIAEYYRFPKDNLFIAVLSNVVPELSINTPGEIAENISALMFGEKYKLPPVEAKINPADLRRYVGEYEFSPGFRLKIELKNNRLIASTEGEEAWSLVTYPTQRNLDKSQKSVKQAVEVIEAFAKGNAEAIRKYLPEQRKATFTMQMVNKVKNSFDDLGSVVKISPYAVEKDGNWQFVLSRVVFPKGERQMRIEIDENGELGGWGTEYAIPQFFPLVPESKTNFFVDGFAYNQPDLHLEFISEGSNVKEIVLKNKDEKLTAVRKN